MAKETEENKKEIRIAIAGIGNCCSALVQGIHFYKDVKDDDELVPGLMHNIIGDYKISDIKIVAAFDIDKRKVGKDITEAIFEKPNCTKIFCGNLPEGWRHCSNGSNFRWSSRSYERLSRRSNILTFRCRTC